MTSKKVSSVEDQPMQRVLRQRELVESLKHDNEVLRLDLTREQRDAKRSTSSVAAGDISRYFPTFFYFMKLLRFFCNLSRNHRNLFSFSLHYTEIMYLVDCKMRQHGIFKKLMPSGKK